MERYNGCGTSGTRPARGSAALRRVRMVLATDSGIGLIETLIALIIFAIVSTALIGMLVSSTSITKVSKDTTIAEEGTASEIEMIKNWAATPDPNASNSPTYDDIGTNPNGNPYGLLPQSQSFNGVNGENLGTPAMMSISVSYASANVPGAYTNGIDYKKVTVTITRNVDSHVLSSISAFVAPPQRAAGNTATINATVADKDTQTGVPGATVVLGTGPSAPRTDTSDSLGKVTFAGLTPNPTTGGTAYYDLTVTPPTGYVVLSDTVSPNAAAHVQLSPSQTYPTTLYIYKPVTAVVSLFNADGTAYANNASVLLTSTRGSNTLAYTGSPLTFTALSNAELLVPGLSYTITASQSSTPTTASWVNTIPTSPATYPTSLSSAVSLTMPTGTVTVTVKNQHTPTAATCHSATVTISGGTLASNVTGTTSSSGAAASIIDVPVASQTPKYTISATTTGGQTGSVPNATVVTGTLPTSNPYTVIVSGTTATC